MSNSHRLLGDEATKLEGEGAMWGARAVAVLNRVVLVGCTETVHLRLEESASPCSHRLELDSRGGERWASAGPAFGCVSDCDNKEGSSYSLRGSILGE